MNKLELLATSLALGGCTLLSRSVPTEVRPILTPPIPTSEQVLRHFTDLNIQVLRGSDVNLEEQSLLELSKAYNSFLTASQKGELSYITSDPNNPLKTGALTESVAGALNIDAKNLPDGAINYALLPTEIKFGNQASVFYQPVLINAIDPSTGNQYQKVVMFGSSDGQNWELVSFTQGSVNILSSQNAGVIIEGTNTVYTSFDKGSPPQITSILIAGGENGALFQSAMYVRGNNGEFELVLRDQEGTESGPLTNSDGLFEVSPPTDNQSPTPSPFKFDVSLVNYKIESPPKIETPTPTATATATPTPTEVPLPAEFLTLAEEHGFSYKVVDGKVMVDLVDGKSVEIDPNQVADWPMWKDVWEVNSNFYLVVKGDNGIPQLRYIEGKGWESVEQTSKIDAFGNIVPGWVVETSPVWDGEPTYDEKNVSRWYTGCGERAAEPGLCAGHANVYIKQWQLLEFITADNIHSFSLQIVAVYNNGNQVITVRDQTYDANRMLLSGVSYKDLLGWLTPGNKVELIYHWGDPTTTVLPADLARETYEHWINESSRIYTPFTTESGCAMVIGQLGANKHPTSFLQDVFNGQYGEFVDLSQDVQIQRIYNR